MTPLNNTLHVYVVLTIILVIFNVFNIKPLARLTAIAIVVYSFILIVVFTTWTSAQLLNFTF